MNVNLAAGNPCVEMLPQNKGFIFTLSLPIRLTAFVLKSFAQARALIFIDESHITDAFTWLSKQQKDSGCFRSSGSLFNNAMKVIFSEVLISMVA